MKKFTKNIGMFLLAVWLVVWGLVALFPAISGLDVVLPVLAIAAGIFVFLDR